ncbi:MAG: hypothetical protein ACO3JL_16560 [Myxococcota bacterium]
MGYLTLSEDEVALLRFTGDLHFVAESPLYEFEARQREPADFARAYEALLHKGVVDGNAFRVTDDALNRLAPVTECDAVVTIQRKRASGHTEERRYCLLEEIAVRHLQHQGQHALGIDMDPTEFWEHLERDLTPRGSGGDHVDLSLTEEEFVVLTTVLRGQQDEPEGVLRGRLLQALGPPPRGPVTSARDELTQHLRAARLAPLSARSASQESQADAWQVAMDALVRSGTLRLRQQRVGVRPALRALADGLAQGDQYTYVRTDFGVGDWLVREVTVVSTPGGLFSLGAQAGGRLRIREMRKDGIAEVLGRTLGPPTSAQEPSASRPLRALLLRGRSAEVASP